MSSQNILELKNVKLISTENKFSNKPKMFFSISEKQYNSLPNCSKSSKVKDGETLFGVSCSPIDNFGIYDKYHRYDLKVGFVPYSWNGKDGYSALCRVMADHGKEQLENKAKTKMIQELMM
jgi:hypothetical protein